ncbi:hypothetical protein SLS58_008253 [Diplodia intermedia]|uniref:Lysine-specific metallo-endopeptidase domain-containing protein n=1 Tax=Diplodia intermedia TaxID=856260 RepID=A0ABR3TI28_9PEZI
MHFQLDRGANQTLVKRSYPALLDFDQNDPAAQARERKVLRGLSDLITLVGVIRATQATNDHAVMDHYFHADDDAKNVADVFDNIWGENENGQGAEALRYVVISDNHAKKWCRDDDRRIAALDNVAGTIDRAALIFCPKAYQFPLLSEMSCDDLGDKVSGRMSSFAGILLHELTHFDSIGKLAIGTRIGDAKFSSGKDVYGPLGTRQYRDDPASVPQGNADQYRWYAQGDR